MNDDEFNLREELVDLRKKIGKWRNKIAQGKQYEAYEEMREDDWMNIPDLEKKEPTTLYRIFYKEDGWFKKAQCFMIEAQGISCNFDKKCVNLTDADGCSRTIRNVSECFKTSGPIGEDVDVSGKFY